VEHQKTVQTHRSMKSKVRELVRQDTDGHRHRVFASGRRNVQFATIGTLSTVIERVGQ
jgi:hypothetical protein